jgi:small-conductance mechanosensitive channel
MLLLQTVTWSEWFVQLITEMNVAIWASVDGMFKGFFGRLPYVLASLIVLIIFWLLSRLFRKIFLAVTKRTTLDARLRILFSRLIAGFLVVLGILSAMTIIIPSFDFGSLIAGLGFTSFVIGFATKDILNNFLSGILILWQRPFHIGDYLFVGSHQGRVEYIGVRATSLRKDDGELVLVPNGDMYSSALTVRGAGSNRRMSLKFNLGYEVEIERAKTITLDALRSTPGIVDDPKPNVYVADLTSDGVSVAATFWINTNESKPLLVFDQASIAVVRRLDEANLELFPSGTKIEGRPEHLEPPLEGAPRKKTDLE